VTSPTVLAEKNIFNGSGLTCQADVSLQSVRLGLKSERAFATIGATQKMPKFDGFMKSTPNENSVQQWTICPVESCGKPHWSGQSHLNLIA